MKRNNVLVAFLAMGLCVDLVACSPTTTTVATSSDETTKVPTPATEETTDSEPNIDSFISKYNEIAEFPIENIESIVVQDKDGDHYKVEFRLNAFRDAVSITGTTNGYSIDIVTYGVLNKDLRIYGEFNDIPTIRDIVVTAATVLDPSIGQNVLDEVSNDIEEKSELNGYYFGEGNEFGILLVRHKDFYEFMFKYE